MPGKGPSLAEVRKALLLLNDVAADGRRIVIEVGLETAELIHDVVGFAVERSDIGGLRRLLTRRRGCDSAIGRGRLTVSTARSACACINARKPENHDHPAEKKSWGESRWVFIDPHRGFGHLALGVLCSPACTAPCPAP